MIEEAAQPSAQHAVSDDDGDKRLYEFVGQNTTNDRLEAAGIDDTRIVHRLSDSRFDLDDNHFTNPVTVIADEKLIYNQPEAEAKRAQFVRPKEQLKGIGYIDRDSKLVKAPFDFSQKKFYPLHGELETLERVMSPDAYLENQQLRLTENDDQFLRTEMRRLPGESRYPGYDADEYDDSAFSLLYTKAP